MKKLLTIFITLFLINYSLSAVANCATLDSSDTTGATCSTCEENYLKGDDGKKCMLGCEAEDTAKKGTCKTCKDGYTLTEGACTEKAASGDSSGSNSKDSKTDTDPEDDNSFGLHYSLLLGLFAFLF